MTTKLDEKGLGYDHVLNAFDTILKKMNVEDVDLYMTHWPTKESQVYTWLVLERIKKEGLLFPQILLKFYFKDK